MIAAAAYRWGVWETVMTSIASVSLLWFESLALRLGAFVPIDRWLVGHDLPVFQEDLVAFDPKRLFMRSVYLVVIGLLMGYLAEQQKKLRAEKDEAGRMLAMIRMDTGLALNLSHTVGEMMRLYRSKRALISSRESGSPKISLASIELPEGTAHLKWTDAGAGGADTYLFPSPAIAWYVRKDSRREGEYAGLGLNGDGAIISIDDNSLLLRFAGQHDFERLLAIVSHLELTCPGEFSFLNQSSVRVRKRTCGSFRT